MHALALILRACLVLVFATAGGAKLLNLRGSRDTMLAFSVPEPLAGPAGTGLPAVELACGAALLFQPTARWGALACLVLLLIFSLGVAYALSQGRTPDCNCFGQVSSSQISWRTLARNATLSAVAAVAFAAGPGASFSSWTVNLSVANAVASAALLATGLLTVVALHLRNANRALRAGSRPGHPIARSTDPLPLGTPAPDFALPALDGTTITLQSLLERGRPLVLVFASPTCAPCRELLPELRRWAGALSDDLTIAVVESGVDDPQQVADQAGTGQDLWILTEPMQDLASHYRVEATPTAIGLDPDGTLATVPAAGGYAIEELVRSVLRHPRMGVAA